MPKKALALIILLSMFMIMQSQFVFAENFTLVPPYTDINSWHDDAVAIDIGIGTTYTNHYTPDQNRIVQLLLAQTYLAGIQKVQALDAIRKHFMVTADGNYKITFDGRTSGEIFIVSSSLVGNAKGGGDTGIEASIIGVDNSTIVDSLYQTERSLGDVFDDVKKTYDELNMIIELQTNELAEAIINEMSNALMAVTSPANAWSEKPFSLSTTAYLKAGTTYYWDLSLVSSVDSIAALNACNATSMKIDVILDEVYLTPLGVSENPYIDRFYSSPSSVVQGAAFVLVAEASDSDGQLTKAEFYRDTDGNGQLDVSVDQKVSEDTNYNLGFGYMGYANLSPGSYLYFTRVQDDDGLWSDPATTTLTVSSSPAISGSYLTIVGTDWNANEEGDEDGVIEAGEDVRLRLRIESSSNIESFYATLNSTVGNLNISDDTEQYPAIFAGENAWPYGSGFDMYLNLASTISVPFTLHVEYTKDGQDYYQNFTFNKTFYENGSRNAAFEIVSFTIDDSTAQAAYNNGDGIIQSGERIEIRPKLKNTGQSGATDIEAWLTYSGAMFSVDGPSDAESYPDLDPGQEEYPVIDQDYDIRDIHRDYAGTQFIDFHLTYDQSLTEVILPNAISLEIQPAAWLKVPEDYWDFGIEAPDTLIVHTTQVQNYGSKNLTITDINTSNADTSWTGDTLPWILAPGASRDLVITIDTTGLQGRISREVTLQSDGRVGVPGEDDILIISGLVSVLMPIFTVPDVIDAIHPDISGKWIVWSEYRNGNSDIFAFDTVAEVELQITTDTNRQNRPFISGNLIVWKDDRNNPGTDDTDIYAYDINKPELGVFPVFPGSAVSPWEEVPVGIANGLVAVARCYEILHDDNNDDEVWNMHVYEYDGNGSYSEVWSTGFAPGSGDNPRQSVSFVSRSDLNEGLFVYTKREYFMDIQSDGDRYWETRNSAVYAIDFLRGDASATKALDGLPSWMSAAAHRFVYSDESTAGDDEIWLWRTSGITQSLVGIVEEDVPDDVLAIGGPDGEDIVVFDWNGSSFRPGLMYIDRENGDQEKAITTSEGAKELRADNYSLVWIDNSDSEKVCYTYLKQSDIAVFAADISFDMENPVEGDAIDVSVLVRNLLDYNLTDDIIVRLYNGDPDNGGTQLGVDQILSGGLAGNAQYTVNFDSVVIPAIAGGSDEEILQMHVRLSVPGYDNPDNNTAIAYLTVYDNDTIGPFISNILVEEYNGDGDGVIGADEQIKISWNLYDYSGIEGTNLSVDGLPISLGGNYFGILGPLAAGEHTFIIDAVDTDASPVSSQYDGSFEVVIAEDITVLFDGASITNGSTLNVVGFPLGAPNANNFFLIRNDGDQTLTMEDLSINVTQGDITYLGPMTLSLPDGSSTYFTVMPDTSSLGLFSCVITLANSDGDENPFNFIINGEIYNPLPGDADGDGVTDNIDLCENTPVGESVDADGCSSSQLDSDNDGITDNLDQCPGTPSGEQVDSYGCSTTQIDSDGDGMPDGFEHAIIDDDLFDNINSLEDVLPKDDYDGDGFSNLRELISVSDATIETDIPDCIADYGIDGDVDGDDLSYFAEELGIVDCTNVTPCAWDMDADGDVDDIDLLFIAEDVGRTDCP